MPAVGLGLSKIDKEATADVVCDAIEIGYRHLDSAADYGNEVEVGKGIENALAAGLCSRELKTSGLHLSYGIPIIELSMLRRRVRKPCRI